ncbi:MAG: hypothetical protein NTX86_01735 [Candidatus Dependentiae bacterium]|nr:hypothetical protein [Candidatus Dependentiae bacterium]
MNKAFLLLVAFSVPIFMVAEEKKEEIKVASIFESIDTKDFPYCWRWKNDVVERRTTRYSVATEQSSEKDILKLAQCKLCKELAAKKMDIDTLSKIMAGCEQFMIKAPAAGWLWNEHIDPQVLAQHDKAMALWNCALLCRDKAQLFTLKEQIDGLLQGRALDAKK